MTSTRIAAIGALISLIGVGASAQLAGAYVVGAGGNYPDLTTALAALQTNGVSAPVQFSVQGNQTGPFTLNAFAGQGASNPVSITASGPVALSGALPLITLNGCSYVTFHGFSASMGAGSGVIVQGSTTSCVFRACSFSMPVTASTSTNRVFSFTGGTSCRIEDSAFGGGYEAFNFAGGDQVTVQRCVIQGGGFWICETSATNFTFKNNFVWGNSNYGFRAGTGSTNLKVHNNSFYIVHTAVGSQYCSLRWYSASPSEVFNNAFHEVQVGAQGYVMWCSGNLAPTVMANNVYYILNGLGTVFWNGVSYTLAGWQGLGNDASSVQSDPLFTNLTSTPPDLHLQNGSPCAGAGMTIATVTDDIDGNSRTPPYDVGADEALSYNHLVFTTTGGGVGDLFISLTAIDPTAIQGYTLVSTYTPFPAGSGPLFGLWPDALTWQLATAVIQPGNPLHFPVGPTGIFPDVPWVYPPGVLSGFAGQTWDVVVVVFGSGFVYLGQSNVVRVTW